MQRAAGKRPALRLPVRLAAEFREHQVATFKIIVEVDGDRKAPALTLSRWRWK
jgi:hypothetical protein